jgi:prolyl-tRNA editing enzyme YbaK/EbsC (Cys-tRNA(Pro) deacylase)
MDEILNRPAVRRVRAAIEANALPGEIKILSESAKTAIDAAKGLGIEVGQIASSLVFKLPDGSPLLVITSGRHRVDTDLVAKQLGISALARADADWVKSVSGFSVGGVAPIGWESEDLSVRTTVIIDQALSEYEVIWAAAGHPHAVFPTSFDELRRITAAQELTVGD